MARHQDDNEQYDEAVARHLAVLVDAEIALLVAMGEECDRAEVESVLMKDARDAAEAEIEAARDKADECRIARHEFA